MFTRLILYRREDAVIASFVRPIKLVIFALPTASKAKLSTSARRMNEAISFITDIEHGNESVFQIMGIQRQKISDRHVLETAVLLPRRQSLDIPVALRRDLKHVCPCRQYLRC